MKHIRKRIITAILAAALLSSGTTAFAAGTSQTAGSPPDKPGSSTTTNVTYSGAETITSAVSQTNQTYSSSTADQNALLVNTSEAVTIGNPTVTKTGNSDGGDNCNFYGINSAIMAKGGTTLTITGGTITASATGANGVFSYGGNGGHNGASGDGTTVKISDTAITTTGGNSGGIMTTGGGVMIAENLTVETSGQSSAPIRTDRGGGTVTVNGGTYTSNGLGSPAIYSTADITVSDAELISNLSEGVCIEGKNSITLNNCKLTANNTKTNGQATFLDTIMIYQSMSGDAESGTSSFNMYGGTLTSKNGHIFHVTNTNAVINLENVTLVNEDNDNIILSVCDDGWSGASNIAELNAAKQTLNGDILVGSDSTLTLKLTDNSTFTGTISGNITNAKGSTVSSETGTVNVVLDSTGEWNLTADTYVNSFTGSADNVKSNGFTLYVNGTPLNQADISENTDTNAASSESDTGSGSSDTSPDMSDTDRPTPPDMSDTDRPTPPDMSDTDKPTPPEMSDTDRPTPPDMSDTDKPTPPDMSDTDRPTPPDMSDTDRPTPPNDMSDTDKPTPPEMSDTDKPTPPDMSDTDRPTPPDISDTDTDTNSDTEAPSTHEHSKRKSGDVEGDGKISAKDSMLIQRYVINIRKLDDTDLKAADVNGDGKVTNKDALEILRYTINLSKNDKIGKDMEE